MATLVTGLEGFVGQHLLRALGPSFLPVFGTALADPPSPPPENVYYEHLDITDTGLLDAFVERAKPSYVVHLAAVSNVGVSIKEPELTQRVNVQGTLNLLESVKRHCTNAAILLISTGEVHGDSRPGSDNGFLEADPTTPLSPYAKSKLQMEEEAVDFAQANGLNVRIVRSYNHTGPGQHERFILSHTAKALAEIKKQRGKGNIPLGDLSVRRDFLDVRDVVRAYCCLLEKGQANEIYNVSSGQAPTLKELVDRMVAISGTKAKVLVDPQRFRPAEISVLCGNSAKLRKETGWGPVVELDDTFAEMISYWEKQGQ